MGDGPRWSLNKLYGIGLPEGIKPARVVPPRGHQLVAGVTTQVLAVPHPVSQDFSIARIDAVQTLAEAWP
jgi:hypothetical protein